MTKKTLNSSGFKAFHLKYLLSGSRTIWECRDHLPPDHKSRRWVSSRKILSLEERRLDNGMNRINYDYYTCDYQASLHNKPFPNFVI